MKWWLNLDSFEQVNGLGLNASPNTNYLNEFCDRLIDKYEIDLKNNPFESENLKGLLYDLLTWAGYGLIARCQNCYMDFKNRKGLDYAIKQLNKHLKEIVGNDEIKLFPVLVPRSLWGKNLRSCFSQSQWQHIGKKTKMRANYRCEYCGRLPNFDIREYHHTHEIWCYDDKNRIQSFLKCICICADCHNSLHLGYALTQHKI